MKLTTKIITQFYHEMLVSFFFVKVLPLFCSKAVKLIYWYHSLYLSFTLIPNYSDQISIDWVIISFFVLFEWDWFHLFDSRRVFFSSVILTSSYQLSIVLYHEWRLLLNTSLVELCEFLIPRYLWQLGPFHVSSYPARSFLLFAFSWLLTLKRMNNIDGLPS